MGFYEDMFEQEAATESRIRHEVKIAVQEAKEEAMKEAEKESQQQKIKTAQILIADGTVSDELISKATGLSMEQISALKEQS